MMQSMLEQYTATYRILLQRILLLLTLASFSQDLLCCSYGTAASSTSGFDCVHIPGAVTNAAVGPGVPAKSNICGKTSLQVTTTAGANNGVVCCEYC